MFYLLWNYILVYFKKWDYSISVYWLGVLEYRNLINIIIKWWKILWFKIGICELGLE